MMALVRSASVRQLDWMVAEALGYTALDIPIGSKGRLIKRVILGDSGLCYDMQSGKPFIPTEDCTQAMPLILEDRICINAYLKPEDGWSACAYIGEARRFHFAGATPLEAAMRCFIARRLGDAVKIPEALIHL